MAYATRHTPARIGGPSADDRAPYYHDACVATDADGFASDDARGRPRVWLGRGACGLGVEQCGACGELLDACARIAWHETVEAFAGESKT